MPGGAGRAAVDRSVNTDSFTGLNDDQRILTERHIPHLKVNDQSELYHVYIFGKEIGQGGFGTVMAVMEKQNSKEWAVKIVVKSMLGSRMKFLQREIQILKLVNHPHIIYLDRIFESPKKIFMVFELCHGGELYELYKKENPFSEDITRKIITDLLSAVLYLHKHDIVHRDLKMENILLAQNPVDTTDRYYIKLTDFGLSILKTGSGIDSMLTECCGTFLYMSPEMLTKHSYSQLCDVWAVGVMMYMLLCGSYPFFSPKEDELVLEICNKQLDMKRVRSSAEAKHLITGLLNKDPANRFTAAEAIEHPWITGKSPAIGGKRPETILDTMEKWRVEMLSTQASSCTDMLSGVVSTDLQEKLRIMDQKPGVSTTTTTNNDQYSAKHEKVPLAVTQIHFSREASGSNAREDKKGKSRNQSKAAGASSRRSHVEPDDAGSNGRK